MEKSPSDYPLQTRGRKEGRESKRGIEGLCEVGLRRGGASVGVAEGCVLT